MDKLCRYILGVIEAIGMLAENQERHASGEAMAYVEKHFDELIKRLKDTPEK